jgi:hypothetical protein
MRRRRGKDRLAIALLLVLGGAACQSDLRIYSRALSVLEIQALAVP